MKISKPEIIVSLTSYPARIKYVKKVVDILKKQTLKANKIILYLAKEDFPKGLAELPRNLLQEIKNKNLEVKFIDLDLKPHNKYFYAMQEYPNEIIITVDDDIELPSTTIEELYNSWIKNKNSVIARRAHLISFNDKDQLAPYNNWIHEFDSLKDIPTMQLFATGCGGVLYPPNCFPKSVFDSNTIKKMSLYADDIWLKVQELIHNIPVVVSSKACKLKFIGDTQEHSLIEQNGENKRNDIYLKNLICYTDKKFNEKNFIALKLINPNVGINIFDKNIFFEIIKELDLKQKKLERKLNKRISKEMIRICQRILYLPRKIYRILESVK